MKNIVSRTVRSIEQESPSGSPGGAFKCSRLQNIFSAATVENRTVVDSLIDRHRFIAGVDDNDHRRSTYIANGNFSW